jgi:hypothetical protein
MKVKKTKEESTSSGARKKKGSPSGGRLTGMLESMQKRSSPINAHKVATKYFNDFKKERQIPAVEPKGGRDTAVDIGESNAVTTAVDSAVISSKQKPSLKKEKESKVSDVDNLLSKSENRVYSVMREECTRRKTNTHRFGLKALKEGTGLSDKTIRVAIHSLEEKMNIQVEEPSLGIYGRKFRIMTLDEVLKGRDGAGLKIDPTTKKVIEKTTAVGSAVKIPIDTAVTTTVITVVDKKAGKKEKIERKK